MKRLFVLIFGGWLCEEGRYHFFWEKNECCWVENTLKIDTFDLFK